MAQINKDFLVSVSLGLARKESSDLAATMKWFNRIVQGFSPGNQHNSHRPERAAERVSILYRALFALKARPLAAQSFDNLCLMSSARH
jgi:hypothetical protein